MLTSRNAALPLRHAVARRRPELLKANGGGCNAILVRGLGGIRVHARRRVCVWPERRVVHAVRVGEGPRFANVHASTHAPRARRDIATAHAAVLRWADDVPLVFGGDFNVVQVALPGFVHAGASHVDHLFARAYEPAAPAETLACGDLSDHAPLLVTLNGLSRT